MILKFFSSHEVLKQHSKCNIFLKKTDKIWRLGTRWDAIQFLLCDKTSDCDLLVPYAMTAA